MKKWFQITKYVIDNETTRLVLSTSELDGVFNPFYSSSGPDNSIIGMTQIGMLSSDKDGKVAYGNDEPCVVLDYQEIPVLNEDGSTKETIYRFVLKNNLKFSNGSPLTMKDVLFNLYVYLDPAYYGSTTIYSTEIKGLEEYRTQTSNKNEQDAFEEKFSASADERILRLKDCLKVIYDDAEGTLSMDAMLAALTAIADEMKVDDPAYGTVVDDYKLAEKYFREELKKDYTYSKGTAQDISFTDKSGNKVTLSTDTEAFLYNEGFIKWNDKDKIFEYSFGTQCKDWSEEQAIETIFSNFFPMQVDQVISYWATANELHTYFAFLEKQAYFAGVDKDDRVESISGIVFANHTSPVEVNGVTYGVPTYGAIGEVTSGNEVLEITIDKVDPKAIWNFAFTVAPMYYYSNEAQIEAFDYVSNFGVEFGSIEFQNNVIKDPDKIGVQRFYQHLSAA